MIIREARRERFTVVSNAALEDARLSFQAKGLLVYLLSKPDGWSVSREQLARVGPNGISSIRAVLTELEQCGYLVRTRKVGEHGHFVWESVVHELPCQPSAENPPMVQPSADYPPMVKPPVDNRTLVKTDVVKTETTTTAAAEVPQRVSAESGTSFSERDPLPVHVQNFLAQSCPDWWEGHLRLALAGRAPQGIANYALGILRGWKRGDNTPQAPLPDVPVYVAPTKAPLLPPGARMLSLSELRDKRAKQNEEFLNATQ